MKEILPQRGIEVTEIERLTNGEDIVSASSVRRYIENGKAMEAFRLVPETTLPWILASAAVHALQRELDLTPKPGLVDRKDCGAHSDMDYEMMSSSIRALYDQFRHIAEISAEDSCLSANKLIEAGIVAEKKMLETTGGINTHKGAIFSLGLAVAATAHLLSRNNFASRTEMSRLIADIARDIPEASGTHGSAVRKKYGIPGALEMARSGYADLFSSWLPLYESIPDEDLWRGHRTLLNIIAGMKDSNIYHRAGEEGMIQASVMARAALYNISEETLSRLNRDYIKANLSPGGAADMLSLTFFLSSVTN